MKCDAKTFAQMYERIYVELYRYALCLMRNPQEAEDAVSEAVLSAYENVHKLRKEEAFKSWIFTILTNVCKRRLNDYFRNSKCELSEEHLQEEAPELDYGLAMDVRNAFFILSQEEQIIVGLSVFGGYNSTEIGQILSLKAGTVRVKRSRALAKMECVL